MKKINFGNKKFPSQYSLKCLFVSDIFMAYCLTFGRQKKNNFKKI